MFLFFKERLDLKKNMPYIYIAMIVDQMLIGAMAVFCYLVVDEATGAAVLIDPAGDFDEISGKISERNARVLHIINTHGHPDHSMGNQEAVRMTGADIMIHRGDLFMLRGNYAASLLEDGDIIRFGKSSLKVVHTPGHSAGSICLYGGGCLFTGDTLFTEGFGRTDVGDASYEAIMHSIGSRILSFPDDTIIYPGHDYGRKPVSTVAEQKKIYG